MPLHFSVKTAHAYLAFVEEIKTIMERERCSARRAADILGKHSRSLTRFRHIYYLSQIDADKYDEVSVVCCMENVIDVNICYILSCQLLQLCGSNAI